MRILRVALLTSLVIAFASPAVAQEAKGAKDAKDAKDGKKGVAELQGIWKFVAIATSEETRELAANEPRWVIKGDTILYGGEALAKLTVDPAATPKLIDLDFIEKKQVHEAIYTLVGDRLTICINTAADGVKERPLDFTVAGKENRRLLVLQREKPGTSDAAVGYGFIGVQIGNNGNGVVVLAVNEKSPAQKAGVKQNDVILKVGTTAITTFMELIDLVRQVRPGSDVTLRIRRGDQEQDITIRAGVRPFMLLD